MHVAKVSKKYVTQSGPRESVSYLLRRTYRDGGKVKHETLANLSALPPATLQAVRASLTGQTLAAAAGAAAEVTRSRPHGHVAAVAAQATALGLPGLLGPAGRMRDVALALIIARVIKPGSKLATTSWWADTTLAEDLGVAGAGIDEVYAGMDWLVARQDSIEKALAARHLNAQVNPARLALFDLSSSWVTGTHCPLAARGYSRDGKKGLPQIEYGLLTDPDGRPVAVRVVAGNTADPTAFTGAVTAVRERFGLIQMVLVGDRGMITSARIEALRELGGMGWVTALRAPAIAALAADTGPLQMSLFDEANLAEISHPDYPGERLIACRNPALAAHRAHKRAALLVATETELAKISAAVTAGRLVDAAAIGTRYGKVIGRYKMGKHFTVHIAEGVFTGQPQPHRHRRRSRPGRHLRHPHPRVRHRAAHRPGRGHRQVAGPGRTRLPQPQGHRPFAAPDPPLHPDPGPGPRVLVHARRLPPLAPAPSLGAVDLHRRAPTRTRRPRRPRATLTHRAHQSIPPNRPRRSARAVLPVAPQPPGHPDPQRHPLRHRPPPADRAHSHRRHRHAARSISCTPPFP